MNEQDEFMDLGTAPEEKNNDDDVLGSFAPESSPPWIYPSSSSISSFFRQSGNSSSSSSLLALPEMSLQRSISPEVELLCDFGEPNQYLTVNDDDDDVDLEDALSEKELSSSCQKATMMRHCSSKEQKIDKVKRTRSAEVHYTAERRRRDKIREKFKALQELMPHCTKKDKASVLEEAANYVNALKLQIESMTKAREEFLAAGYMQCFGTPYCMMPISSMAQTIPIRPGLDMTFGSQGLCRGCLAPYPHCIQIPSGVHPNLVGGDFPFQAVHPMTVRPTAGANISGETEP